MKGRQVTAKNCEDTCTKQCSCKSKKDGSGDVDGTGKCSSDEEADYAEVSNG